MADFLRAFVGAGLRVHPGAGAAKSNGLAVHEPPGRDFIGKVPADKVYMGKCQL